jgi:hypothetical protein
MARENVFIAKPVFGRVPETPMICPSIDQLSAAPIYHALQQTGTRSLPDFALESF